MNGWMDEWMDVKNGWMEKMDGWMDPFDLETLLAAPIHRHRLQ